MRLVVGSHYAWFEPFSQEYTPTGHEDVDEIKLRLLAQERQNERQIQYINSMHSWAAKTADTLREMQRQCEGAEAAALAAQRESLALRVQLAQLAAQQDANNEAVARVEGHVAALGPQHRSKTSRAAARQRDAAPAAPALTADSLNTAHLRNEGEDANNVRGNSRS